MAVERTQIVEGAARKAYLLAHRGELDAAVAACGEWWADPRAPGHGAAFEDADAFVEWLRPVLKVGHGLKITGYRHDTKLTRMEVTGCMSVDACAVIGTLLALHCTVEVLHVEIIARVACTSMRIKYI